MAVTPGFDGNQMIAAVAVAAELAACAQLVQPAGDLAAVVAAEPTSTMSA